MNRTKSLTIAALIPLMGVVSISCAPMQKYDYEIISTTSVDGETFEVVERTPLGEDNQAINGAVPELGILDPSNTFHRCSGAQCTDEDLRLAAVHYEAESQKREGGGGGGGDGGGGGM